MKKILKKSIALLLTMITLFCAIPVFAESAENPNNPDNEKVVNEPIGILGATVKFYDPTLLKEKSSSISPMGVIHEEYDHSYFSFDHSAISSYNVGPRSNDIFLLSVARGQTLTLSYSKTISGSVEFSMNFSAPLKEVINIGLVGKASGTYSYTYNTTDQYVGPSAPYNSRDYYGAINYDLYTCYVNQYNVYRVYNGNTVVGYETYYQGILPVSDVKGPKAVLYSKDFVQ